MVGKETKPDKLVSILREAESKLDELNRRLERLERAAIKLIAQIDGIEATAVELKNNEKIRRLA